MEGFLRVEATTATLPHSPTNSFLADEVASTCPLLTPSPPTNDLINPLPESEQPTFVLGKELTHKLKHVTDSSNEGGDSASSSSSALAEPSCTQLLNHKHPTYHHISKDENISSQETNGKVQQLQLTFKNPPDDYFFMSWNWPLIRKISWWAFVAGLIAMASIAVAMVSSLPKTCNPPTEWYRGGVLYEIFPASFYDSDDDTVGDLRGISLKANYLSKLGVAGIRLNSIFRAHHFPENYKNVTSLVDIAPELGTLNDFKLLVDALHLRNISLVLDLPLWPLLKDLKQDVSQWNQHNSSFGHWNARPEFLVKSDVLEKPTHDVVTEAILFWIQHGVDGFYIKGLEHYVDTPAFIPSLRKWKQTLGQDRPIIVTDDVIAKAPKQVLSSVLANVDLVDIQLNIEHGVPEFSKQIESILNGTLFSKANMPWVHWSLGNVDSSRLADRLPHSNATLGATLLQLLLPGTPSIFYGDEIGLRQTADPHDDRKDLAHLYQLGAMAWEKPKGNRPGARKVLPWMHGNPTRSNFDQLELISRMLSLRSKSPAIYVNAVRKDGGNKATAEVKYSQDDLVVIQRWYPRRKNFVVVSNLGSTHKIGDLSKSLYSGEVIVGPKAGSLPQSVSFNSISLWPGESVVILLD